MNGPLRRSLSRRDLIVYGLLFIGPLAPVGVFGVLDARTNGAVALVYVVATIAMDYRGYCLPLSELISDCNFGMMQAVTRFYPDPALPPPTPGY